MFEEGALGSKELAQERRVCDCGRAAPLLLNSKRPFMTNSAVSAALAEGDFRVGRVLNQSASVLQRNLLPLFLIGAIAYLPVQLLAFWFTNFAQLGARGAI